MTAPTPSARRPRGGADQRRPTQAAVDQAEHRQRERDGVIQCVYVPIKKVVLEAMIDRGLEDCGAKDIGRDAADILWQWAMEWNRRKNFP
jgi:hypothetical protein